VFQALNMMQLSGATKKWLEAGDETRTAWFLGSTVFVLYFFSYWWNVTMFMMPNSPHGGLLGSDLLTTIGLAQMLGYSVSKIPATKVVAMVNSDAQRDQMLAACLIGGYLPMAFGIALCGPAGLAFGVFLASLPASWTWGVLVLYIEGRQATEAMVAAMSSAFIFGGGAARAVGAMLIAGPSEPGATDSGWLSASPQWMPAVVGGIGCIGSLLCLLLLRLAPPPSRKDVRVRSARTTMTLAQQRQFVQDVAPGVAMCVSIYVLVTAFRKFKDYFPRELFAAMLSGTGEAMPSPSTFFWTETPAAIISALILASMIRIKDSRTALLAMLGIQACGGIMMIGSTLLYEAGLISPATWWAVLSVALYGTYTCMGTALYDRLVSVMNRGGTCVFLVFISDGIAYVFVVGKHDPPVE
jgi:hypothetical protein